MPVSRLVAGLVLIISVVVSARITGSEMYESCVISQHASESKSDAESDGGVGRIQERKGRTCNVLLSTSPALLSRCRSALVKQRILEKVARLSPREPVGYGESSERRVDARTVTSEKECFKRLCGNPDAAHL